MGMPIPVQKANLTVKYCKWDPVISFSVNNNHTHVPIWIEMK